MRPPVSSSKRFFVSAISAAAPTTLGKLVSSVVGFGGSSSSMRAQMDLKIEVAMREPINPAMIPNGL